jgi:hypothetical protein
MNSKLLLLNSLVVERISVSTCFFRRCGPGLLGAVRTWRTASAPGLITITVTADPARGSPLLKDIHLRKSGRATHVRRLRVETQTGAQDNSLHQVGGSGNNQHQTSSVRRIRCLAPQRIAIQCKHWNTSNLGVKAVREFLGAACSTCTNCAVRFVCAHILVPGT